MQDVDIQNNIIELVQKNGLKPRHIQRIAESGSARRYYRIHTEEGSIIGAFNSNTEENEAFFYLCHHFGSKGFHVPKLLGINADRTCYLQNDFGDDTLFRHVQRALSTDGWNGPVTELYKMVLHDLADFQISGHEGLDYSKTYPTPCFDRKSILDDLNYFKYYFVKPHAEIAFNEFRLDTDFERFTDFILEARNSFFMHRDFQSRNIMINNGIPRYIDFQGGRQGPLQYDVVSLLYQVKAQMPQDLRNKFIEYYKSIVAQHLDLDTLQFDRYLPAFVYLRLMQVLGAYGFRGLIQKKVHFIESIPFALREIERHAKSHPLQDLPELVSVIEQLNKLDDRYLNIHHPTNKLTVTINSFSYRKGYPNDFSGNGGGFVFDCRALPNPGREERFKTMNGRDWPVIDFMNEKPQTHVFFNHCKAVVEQSITNYIERHFSNLMVSFGCTGGQHRSVFFAQSLYEWMKKAHPDICIKLHHIEQKINEKYGE